MSTSKTIALTLFLATTLFASCNAAANATTKPLFPAILIFGDSTVDTGNNNYPLNTIFKATHFPYGIDLPDHKANGRFSNGKLIPDILAGKFNIKQFVPPFLQPNLSDQEIVTGVCFASAGSGYDDLTSLSTQAIPVSEQPKMFRNYIARLKSIVGDKKAMEIINNALVVISAGTNDMVLNFYTIPTRRLEFPFISGYHEFILKRLDGFIGELYSLGARNIAIAGLPPIGCLPIQMTAKFRNIFRFCLEQENKDSVVYNQKLQKLLPQIQSSHTGSKIFYADIYNPIFDMMQNPSKYGIDTIFSCAASFHVLSTMISLMWNFLYLKQGLQRRREDVVEQGFWRQVSCVMFFLHRVRITLSFCSLTPFIHRKLPIIT
ncbi:GDSL esterase/lipase At2g31550-like isoform X1 [Brassica rapa]|uniref:GDSL esterase/lipase At2g31550-like isoform X1 n=1 Tax=Brassica campestris TaxID=3711 RepID=UPI00142D4826|nr:GDSL esterase/lipase At2g31550-like isoform X1 [Brassica rapa]